MGKIQEQIKPTNLKYAGEAYLNFNKTIAKDHSLSAMVGSSFEVSNQLAYNIAVSFSSPKIFII